MSFNEQRFKKQFTHTLTIKHGFSSDIAEKVAALAVNDLRKTHGPGRHYIQAEKPDYAAIRAEYAAGVGVSELSRRYGLDYKTIRKIISN